MKLQKRILLSETVWRISKTLVLTTIFSEHLELTGNDIVMLGERAFYIFDDLKMLTLHKNNIKHIAERALEGLSSMNVRTLKHIYCYLNKLKHVNFQF